jgi:hypothetical protein
MAFFRVDTREDSGVRIRSKPDLSPSGILAVIPEGRLVELIDEEHHPWWRVRVELAGSQLEGFVASRLLVPDGFFAARDMTSQLAPVHLRENWPRVTRMDPDRRAFPIGEPGRPGRTASGAPGKVTEILNILNWLDVERSERYAPNQNATFCNIYAYDVCYLAGVYLPRVWWKPTAVERLARGEFVTPLYGETLFELNANALFNWLGDFGPRFGWRRVFSLDAAQDAANAGEVVVLAAQRVNLNQPGHIVVLAPEHGPHGAVRSGGEVVRPLQSQAGASNKKLTTGTTRWWADANRFRAFGAFAHA